jgi:hypothetical protein
MSNNVFWSRIDSKAVEPEGALLVLTRYRFGHFAVLFCFLILARVPLSSCACPVTSSLMLCCNDVLSMLSSGHS